MCALFMDWETNGLDYSAELFGVAVHDDSLFEGEPWWIPLDSPEQLKEEIDLIVRNTHGPIVFHNAAFDLSHFDLLGIEVPRERVQDTMLMSYLLDPSKGENSLEYWGAELLCPKGSIVWKTFLADPRTRLQKAHDPELIKYALQDIRVTETLWHHLVPLFRERCEENPKFREMYFAELKYMQFLIQCRHNGYQVDLGKLPEAKARIEGLLDEVKGKLSSPPREIAYVKQPADNRQKHKNALGQYEPHLFCTYPETNWNSGAHKMHQLKRVGWYSTGQTAKGNEACASDSLEPFIHEQTPRGELCRMLNDYQTLNKLLSTYLSPISEKSTAEGILRGNFNQCATKTKRLSSSDPNLQNLARRGEYGGIIRELFIAPPGYVFASCDLDQIEFRVVAHFMAKEMKDYRLIKPFLDGVDVHTYNQELWGLASRDDAKKIIYTILFGGGPRVCGDGDMKKGKKLLEAFHKANPNFEKWKENVVAKARKQGGQFYNDFGSLFTIPNMNSKDNYESSSAARSCISCKVQGTAGDIFKHLTNNSYELWSSLGAVYRGPVHDEVTFSIPEEGAAEIAEKIKNSLYSPPDGMLICAVQSQIKTGDNWKKCH